MHRSRTTVATAIACIALAVASAANAAHPAVPEDDPDRPFPSPQYLIHITGHGTTSGDVEDDAYIIFNHAPVDGGIVVSDGTGGTFGYRTDSSAGPFIKPSEVCKFAAGLIGEATSIGSFGNARDVDCGAFAPGGAGAGGGGAGTSGGGSGSTASSTVTTDEEPYACSLKGRVIDVYGEPVAGIHIHVEAGRLRLDTSTLLDGSYYFAEIGDNPGAGKFDPRTDKVKVSLYAEEQAHDPQRFIIAYRQQGPTLSAEPFLIGDSTTCEFDFDMRAIPSNYISTQAPIEDWPAIVQIYQGIHRAWALADMLGISLDYGLPLQIYAWCDSAALGCDTPTVGFVGSFSDGAQIVEQPYIVMTPGKSRLNSPNRPDNREYHEFGHYVQAAALGGLPDIAGGRNHIGYANPNSSDSWVEGFAEFWSVMVAKYIDGNPDYEFYDWSGGSSNLFDRYTAWQDEEFAVASVLTVLEALSTDAQPERPRTARTFKVNGYTEVTDPTLGRLIVGRVTNTTPDGASYGTIAGATFFDANDRIINASYANTIPANIGAGAQGLFVLVVPNNITYSDLAIVVREGRPKKPDPPAPPFDVTLPEIWSAISNYHSTKELSGGRTYDVDDLYNALKNAFAGRGQTVDGQDTIDALFIRSGFHENTDGDFVFDPDERIGWSSHPGYGDQLMCNEIPRLGCSVSRIPRTDYIGPPEASATITLRSADGTAITGGEVFAQVMYPEPDQDLSYGYVVVPDEAGVVDLAVPPPDSPATVVLIAIADGHTPTVLGTISPSSFWADAAAHDGRYLAYTATLPVGDLVIPDGLTPVIGSVGGGSGGVGLSSVAILVGGLALAVGGGAFVGRRRRRRSTPPPIAP